MYGVEVDATTPRRKILISTQAAAMRYRDLTARDVGRRRSDVRVVAVRVVRTTMPPPREGCELLFSDRNSSDHRLPDDVHEGSLDARRSRRHARCKDGIYVFCMDIGKLRGALEHAELPRRDVVGTLRH